MLNILILLTGSSQKQLWSSRQQIRIYVLNCKPEETLKQYNIDQNVEEGHPSSILLTVRLICFHASSQKHLWSSRQWIRIYVLNCKPEETLKQYNIDQDVEERCSLLILSTVWLILFHISSQKQLWSSRQLIRIYVLNCKPEEALKQCNRDQDVEEEHR